MLTAKRLLKITYDAFDINCENREGSVKYLNKH